MAKKKTEGEGKLPLILALAFFVITTIALGVFFYQSNSEIETANNEAKKAKDESAAAQKQASIEADKVKLYKAFLGTASKDEIESLQNTKNAAEVRDEHTKLINTANGLINSTARAEAAKFVGAGGPQFDVVPTSVYTWNWPTTGTLPAAPSPSPLLDRSVKIIADRELALRQASRVLRTVQDLETQLTKELEAYRSDKVKLTALIADIPKQIEDAKKLLIAEVEARKNEYTESAATFRQQATNLTIQLNNRQTELLEKVALLNQAQETLELERQKEDAKRNVLPFDKPKGNIVRRRQNLVEINLGSADNLRTGVTFSVQPLDFEEAGELSRVRQVFGPDGRPLKDAEDNFVRLPTPKGTIEITEVLGPNLSVGIITSEYDREREPILTKDLIYNAVWQKGGKEHIVIYGIFDIDGNGSDDIKQVVRDMEKVGCIVDGYFDLASNTWAMGKPSERTAYAIEGEFPSARPNDGLIQAKDELIKSIVGARTDAKEKAIKIIKYRDFFPRVGYNIKYGVSDDFINQAASRYLKTDDPATPGDRN